MFGKKRARDGPCPSNDGGSYVGQLFQRCGGVARNHADAIARLGCESVLISAVGEDDHGDYLRQQCSHIDISGVVSISNASTATYMSMNQKGNVRYGVSSIGKVLSLITPEMITQKEKVIGTADFLLLDSNLSVETMKKAIEIGSYYKRKIWVEPTDIKKMNRVFKTGLVRQITATSPNANEFRMWAQECGVQTTDKALSSPETVADFVLGNKVLLQDLSFLVVSLAEKGSVVVSKNEKEEYELRLVPAPVDSTKVFSVSGAGDSFNSGVMCALASGKTVDEALEVGQICAALTLQTPLAVSTSITPKILFD
ncbi:unnamed protein product [Caenorhabditis auriculariae]|uniref:Carbohydrate kinase PfkB domain-containing protein n=1 Tax=Caenorhabditis auriculariae TaxID=2777116 RepID=A0A8S1GUH5_9PELO|nr:unnamed protein product [Caenorhabditis auriculariae]